MPFTMSLRWSSYVAPKPPKGGGGSKTQNGRFSSKIALRLKKVCYKVSLCETVSGLTNRAKMIGWGDPFYLKFWIKLTALERNRRFSISFRSYIATHPYSEKVSLTLIRSALRAFQWVQDEHHTLSLSRQGGSKTQSVQNLNNKLR